MSNIVDECEPSEKVHSKIQLFLGKSAPITGSHWYPPVKLSLEWLAALVLLILTSPLCLFLAILVKFSSPGPVFYAQSRLGLNSRVFRMFKFRTMVQDAESRTGPVWALKNDSRITSIGRILRATHLDELPQLWNILRGEMSLIGPRPERPEIALRIVRQIPEFRRRLAVRPGVTGLSQMLLPADDPNDAALNCVRQKLVHDLVYIQKMGPAMDFRIAVSTPCYFLAAAIHAVQEKLVRKYQVIEETDSSLAAKEDGVYENALTANAAK